MSDTPTLPLAMLPNLGTVTPVLSLTGELAAVKLIIPPEAETRKATLMASAGKIVRVTSVTEQEAAQGELHGLMKLRTDVEKGRKAVKDPVWEMGKTIDATAAAFIADAKKEEERIEKLVADYGREVARQAAEEADRLRRLEEQRAAEERAAAAAVAKEKAAAEAAAAAAAERARIALAEAEAAAAVPVETEDDEMEAMLARAAAIDAENEAKRLADQAATVVAPAPVNEGLQRQIGFASAGSRVQAKGITFPLTYQVTDLAELYKHHPELVTLSPKANDIIAKIKAEEVKLNGGIPTIPGLNIFRDTKVSRFRK
jgi:hypothetical protein